ncbi:hypothetical protein HNP73_002742 [Amaricoccus macauensis]|uniref:Transcriptional regulator n=1 Tax=Amaricoccus macauensis TaxID=57001 RepID=A0A840SSL6_9RHOB|nr:hypothetical protein [Amaricoccus macauensis]MBB5222806.1 hypothetical protein [Amaricoccus macauensis]
MRFIRILAICGVLLMPGAAWAQLSMVMVEQEGCVWCARWNTEIAEIWPKTREGQAAPLRRVDLNAPLPGDLEFDSPPRITPTFVLMDGPVELGRIEGYAGDQLFWMMITVIFDRVGPQHQLPID